MCNVPPFWDGYVSLKKELAELFEVCNKQNVSVHKSLWAAVQVVQREIYSPRMENPCSPENAMNINIFELKLEPAHFARFLSPIQKMSPRNPKKCHQEIPTKISEKTQ